MLTARTIIRMVGQRRRTVSGKADGAVRAQRAPARSSCASSQSGCIASNQLRTQMEHSSRRLRRDTGACRESASLPIYPLVPRVPSTEKPRSVEGRGRGSFPPGRGASVKRGERPPQMVILKCGGALE